MEIPEYLRAIQVLVQTQQLEAAQQMAFCLRGDKKHPGSDPLSPYNKVVDAIYEVVTKLNVNDDGTVNSEENEEHLNRLKFYLRRAEHIYHYLTNMKSDFDRLTELGKRSQTWPFSQGTKFWDAPEGQD